MLRIQTCCLIVIATPMLWAGADLDGANEPRKYSGTEVEVRLRDGSLVRGDLTGLDSIVLKTKYGMLSFPLTRMLSIIPRVRVGTEEQTEIKRLIKDLDNDDYNTRGKAQKKLEQSGAQAVIMLREALPLATAEQRARIDSVLKKLEAKGRVEVDDLVIADEFQARGALQLETLPVHSIAGDMAIKLEEIAQVRWLGNGTTKTMALDAALAVEDWIDTGVDAVAHQPLVVNCSGMIQLFGSNPAGPQGMNNWGATPFLTGAVIGKLGESGKPFLIGTGKRMRAESSQRLFVKIYTAPQTQSGNPSNGEFSLQIATGTWADEPMQPSPGATNNSESQLRKLIRIRRR